MDWLFQGFFCALYFLFSFIKNEAQNVLEKKLPAENIKSISINDNQIFTILVSTSRTNDIIIVSRLDGEYQNQFQIRTEEDNSELKLSLEKNTFTAIADDK